MDYDYYSRVLCPFCELRAEGVLRRPQPLATSQQRPRSSVWGIQGDARRDNVGVQHERKGERFMSLSRWLIATAGLDECCKV